LARDQSWNDVRRAREDATAAAAAAADAAAAAARIDLDAASAASFQLGLDQAGRRRRSRLKSCLVGIRAITSAGNDATSADFVRDSPATGTVNRLSTRQHLASETAIDQLTNSSTP